MTYSNELVRIEKALAAAAEVLKEFTPGAVEATLKNGGDPVTEADLRVNERLRTLLPMNGEGWLSEESVDDPNRLKSSLVWIVDPIDGTREFIAGIPEWCISIGLCDKGHAVAGGIYNPATGETFLGGPGMGLTLNGARATCSDISHLQHAVVLASRSEYARGEWDAFQGEVRSIKPLGSVAYKLALVAVGLADASWTLVPKNEWDVAAGAALVLAGGGRVSDFSKDLRFNRPNPLLGGFLGAGQILFDRIDRFLRSRGDRFEPPPGTPPIPSSGSEWID